jgi:hypothetical protein
VLDQPVQVDAACTAGGRMAIGSQNVEATSIAMANPRMIER